MENLHQDFKEFLVLLNKHEVEYLLVGGYAVALHGYPRYTGDIDFWVNVSEKNAKKLVSVLKEFGFDVPELSTEMFLDPLRMTRMGNEPIKIEILNSISGVSFDQGQRGAISIEIEGINIPVIGLKELRQNKKSSARAKDLADLENLPTNPSP
jgi:predicted nucleotidyltransferase